MNPYSLLWIMGAGTANAIMDTIAHRPHVWKFLGDGKLYKWVVGEISFGKGKPWMVGPLYALMNMWHCAKVIMWFCVMMAVVSNVDGTLAYKFVAFIILALSQWIGFLSIYKGVLK